jgi:selenocysteine lyase/cysteine desulfurase
VALGARRRQAHAMRARPTSSRPGSATGDTLGATPPLLVERAAALSGGSPTVDFADVRRLFPGATRRAYLDAAAISITSTRSAEAIARFLERVSWDPSGAHHGTDAAQARHEAARLIGARPEQIALTPATSLGLNVAADAVPLRRGENVVTCDLEFMSVVVPWLEKCRAVGAELRVVRHEAGRIAADAVASALDDQTRAVVLSSVQWTNGYRLDIQRIGRECRRRGIPFVVDAIQHLGVVPLDVEDSAIDYLACGGHKWLASPTALGFAYASDGFVERFRPSLTYAPTAVPPGGDWRESWTDPAYDPIQTYALPPTAARFEVGVHHGAVGGAGLAAALAIFNEVGPARIAEHAAVLGDRVAAGVRALDLELVTHLDREHRSGLTVFRTGSSSKDDLALRDYLLARDVVVSVRFTSGVGGIRVSTHVYNDESDVDRLLDTVHAWLKTR